LYNRGIRRRLAAMLGNDRRRLELAFSLLLALPGTPMLQYGDEIGIGDDLSLPEREAARTPMQWTAERHGGFSRAEEVVRPVIDDNVFGYQRVNVADQRRDVNSLLNWLERMIRMRRECPEIGWGEYELVRTNADAVLALRYDWRNTALVVLHNFSAERLEVSLPLDDASRPLVNLLNAQSVKADKDGQYYVELEPYGYRWLRVGACDPALDRTEY
jgi:maltose alpha-D-glucosyltransferase/alpha-amylase